MLPCQQERWDVVAEGITGVLPDEQLIGQHSTLYKRQCKLSDYQAKRAQILRTWFPEGSALPLLQVLRQHPAKAGCVSPALAQAGQEHTIVQCPVSPQVQISHDHFLKWLPLLGNSGLGSLARACFSVGFLQETQIIFFYVFFFCWWGGKGRYLLLECFNDNYDTGYLACSHR